MIAWGSLEKDITSWLEDLSEKTTDDTAKFFADSYAQAVTAGADPMMNAIIPPGKEAGIETAWKAAFAAQAESDSPLGVPNWLPVATAIVLYWTGGMVSPATPHPPTVVPISNIITFPGVPPGIASGIDTAFKQEEAPSQNSIYFNFNNPSFRLYFRRVNSLYYIVYFRGFVLSKIFPKN